MKKESLNNEFPEQQDELYQQLNSLKEKLRQAEEKYHVKSDDHDIFGYELGNIERIAKNLHNRRLVNKYIDDSTLLSAWGQHTRKKEPALTEEISSLYSKLKNAQESTASQSTSRPDDPQS